MVEAVNCKVALTAKKQQKVSPKAHSHLLPPSGRWRRCGCRRGMPLPTHLLPSFNWCRRVHYFYWLMPAVASSSQLLEVCEMEVWTCSAPLRCHQGHSKDTLLELESCPLKNASMVYWRYWTWWKIVQTENVLNANFSVYVLYITLDASHRRSA